MADRPHYVLAVDPGITTGWAILNEAGDILGSGNIEAEEVGRTLDYLVRKVHKGGGDPWVVVEKFPIASMGSLGMGLRAVIEKIAEVWVTYELVPHMLLPGEWKTSAQGRAFLPEKEWDGLPLSTHQQDAVRMGRYYLARRGGNR